MSLSLNPSNKLYILAGDRQQAARYAQQAGFEPGTWSYVSQRSDLIGVHDFSYIKIGTWYECNESYDILGLIDQNGGREGTPRELKTP